jgi:hypothetical protein
MSLFLFFNTQTKHIESIIHNSIAMFFPKNPMPWRESNPGLLFPRQIRCPLRNAARGQFFKTRVGAYATVAPGSAAVRVGANFAIKNWPQGYHRHLCFCCQPYHRDLCFCRQPCAAVDQPKNPILIELERRLEKEVQKDLVSILSILNFGKIFWIYFIYCRIFL